MNLYRIKHKPTGLYYKPAKNGNTLSKTGKVYHKKPNLKWCSVCVKRPRWNKPRIHKELEDWLGCSWEKLVEKYTNKWGNDMCLHSSDCDWEIEEIKV